MMSIAMPQPAKVKDPCSCRPASHARLTPTQTLHTGGCTGSGVDTVYQGNGDNLPRTPQWQMIKGRRDRAGALPNSRRWQGGRAGRERGELHSPCRAGMAFHTDTGPWLANWPSDTSRKKMGKPASASIIR